MRAPPPDSVGGWGHHCSAGSCMSAMEDVGPSSQRAKAKGKSALWLRPLLGRPKMMRARAYGGGKRERLVDWNGPTAERAKSQEKGGRSRRNDFLRPF
jgi:hypothetical protein